MLNARVAVGGAVRVGLTGPSVPAGFSVADADEWTGDAVRGLVTWGAGTRGLNLSSLASAGAPVAITFHLARAVRLYAFEFRCV